VSAPAAAAPPAPTSSLTATLLMFLRLLAHDAGVMLLRSRSGIGAPTEYFLRRETLTAGFLPDVVLALLEEGGQVVVGPATRVGEGDRAPRSLGTLFADLNFSPEITANGWTIPQASEIDVRGRLKAFTLAPSIVANSGWGLHVYWLLEEPLDLRREDRRAHAAALLRRLAERLGGETRALTIPHAGFQQVPPGGTPTFTIAACDPARMLRVPGSLNTNRGSVGRVVHVEQLEVNHRYRLDMLDAALRRGPKEGA